MEKHANKIKILFITGSLLLLTIAIVLVLASLCFFLNIGISSWQFPISFVLSIVISYLFNKRDISQLVTAVIISIVIIILSILLALVFYDLSYDGQTYHMEAIYRLKNGWNPFKSLLDGNIDLSIYINHYSKGVEIPQSTIYSLINRIEAAKATNFIILCSVFCLILSYLISLNKFSTLKNTLISLLAVLNPVVVNQLISTYVDGQMALIMLCFLILVLWIVKQPSYFNFILLASAIIIGTNIKFTGLVFMVIFSMAFIIWLAIIKATYLRKIISTILLGGFTAVCIVGYNPYVVNTFQFEHPFYPLMGKEKVDIMTNNSPKEFIGKSNINNFLTSLFARTDNVRTTDTAKRVELKIPFTINKVDISNAPQIDTRVAGFGPLFSGILLISLVLASLTIYNYRKLKEVKGVVFIIATLIISVLIVPEAWWVRYIPQLWYLPLIFLVVFELYSQRKRNLIPIVIYLCFLINISFTFIGIGFNFVMSSATAYQIKKLRAYNQPIFVDFNIFKSNRIRLRENNIAYIEKDLSKEKNVEIFIKSYAIYLIPKTKINIPKSNLVKWGEKFQYQPQQSKL